MPKTITPALKAHISSGVTTLATCVFLTRVDGKTFAFTTHDQDLTIDGTTYVSMDGYSRTAITSDASLATDNVTLDGFIGHDSIDPHEVRAGLFDRASLITFLVNWKDLSQGTLRLRKGWFGDCTMTKPGTWTTEFRGLVQTLSQQIGEVYSAECRADLGDSRCKVPLYPDPIQRSHPYILGDTVIVADAATTDGDGHADSRPYHHVMFQCTQPGSTAVTAPAFDYGWGNTTTDGGTTWIAKEAWTTTATIIEASNNRRTMRVALIDADSRYAKDWFVDGLLDFETGPCAGMRVEVKDDDGAGHLALYLPLGFQFQVGDRVLLSAGCQRTLDHCLHKFNNILNMRAEPYLPGIDTVISVVTSADVKHTSA
jgi:hypothetical protein